MERIRACSAVELGPPALEPLRAKLLAWGEVFVHRGVLHEGLLPWLWRDVLQGQDKALVRELPLLMEQLSVIVRCEDGPGGAKRWLVPVRLPETASAEPALCAELSSAAECVDAGRLYAFAGPMPSGLAQALLVRWLGRVGGRASHSSCWRRGLAAQLRVPGLDDEAAALHVHVDAQEREVTLRLRCRARRGGGRVRGAAGGADEFAGRAHGDGAPALAGLRVRDAGAAR